MKKSLLIAALAGFALVSCTENDLDQSVKVQEPICFSAPVVKPNTKAATEVGGLYDESLRFRVWGHYYTGNYTNFAAGQLYIKDAECAHSGNTWIPKNNADDTYYWPKNGTLTFIAYHPATTANVTVGANGLTISNYSVNSTQPNNDMQDLMFSERAYNMKKSSQGTLDGTYSPYAGVDLQFRHALASIAFNAKLDGAYSGTTVTIKGISLSNVSSIGTFNQNLTDANNATTNTNRLGDTDAVNKAAWTSLSGPVKYTVDLTATKLSTTPFWPCGNTSDDNFRDTDLMLIPQPVSDVTLRIDYSIQTPDSAPIDQYYEAKLTGTWNIGYRYVYNITFGFDPITFAPTVDVWQEISDLNVNGKDYMND